MNENINSVIHFVPLLFAALLWYVLYAFNKRVFWFRVGELIFWDAAILITTFLIWLKFF